MYNGLNTEETIGETIFSGEPTARAKRINIRELIRTKNIQSVNGDSVNVDDLIGTPSDAGKTSIVVFLRSLG